MPEKPDYYNSSLSLEENMIEFKRNGKHFKMSDLQSLECCKSEKFGVYKTIQKLY